MESIHRRDLHGLMRELLPVYTNILLSDDGYYYYFDPMYDIGVKDMDGNVIIEAEYEELTMLIDIDALYNYFNNN